MKPWLRQRARADESWRRDRRRWTKFSWPGPGQNPSRRILMHTPVAALAWELWHKHRTRLISVIGLILAFALVYPKLCAQAGFDPHGSNALDEIVKKFAHPGVND